MRSEGEAGELIPCGEPQGTVACGVVVSLLWGLGFLAVELAFPCCGGGGGF